jgi:hypothetical protein
MSGRQRVRAFGWVLGLAAAGWLVCGTTAAEKAKGDATGNWKSSFKTPQGQTIVTSYKLKQDGEKLTGTVIGRDKKEVKIDKGSVKDGKVSFDVTREFNGQKFTMNYGGKIEGDSIKGKISFTRGDQTRSFPWEAKREKADK